MIEFLDNLNPEQNDAVTTVNGYVKILAGAGTGKTKTLVARTAYLLEQGVMPEHILLVTFTKKAAKEMRDRIKALLQDDRADRISACTFHSFAAELLRTYGIATNFVREGFTIISSRDAEDSMKYFQKPVRDEYLKKLKLAAMADLREQGYTDGQIKKALKTVSLEGFPTAKQLLEMKSLAINHLIDTKAAIKQAFEESQDTNSPLDEQYLDDAYNIINDYQTYKEAQNYLDYDDLLLYLDRLLIQEPGVRKALDLRYRYIMCDEYQDTNIIQEDIINRLSEDVSNVCIVGDDNQSIYKFRGAVIENIITFGKRHTPCKEIKLIRNYRSTQEILDTANAVMSHALEGEEKELVSANGSHGQKPVLISFSSSDEEARYIVTQIRSIMQQNPDLKYKDFAIISRAGRQTFAVEKELNTMSMPYKKFGGTGFFDLESVNIMLSLLKVSQNVKKNETDKDIDWLRSLNLISGIGPVNAKNLYWKMIVPNGIAALLAPEILSKAFGDGIKTFCQVLAESKPITRPTDLIRLFSKYYYDSMYQIIINRDTTDEKKREALAELKEEMKNLKVLEDMSLTYRSVSAMLDDFVLNRPQGDDDEDYITVSTIHSVKGLEFHTVFFTGPVMGVIPHVQEDLPDTREDLRCMYVALTRAKKNLHITYPVYAMGNEQVLSCHLDKPDILKTLTVIHKESYQKPFYQKWNFRY